MTSQEPSPLSDLPLERPLVCFDIESTGTNAKTDRIIDLALIRVLPGHRRESYQFRVHPGVPIPPETTAIHGISDDDVVNCPRFCDIADEVRALFLDVDLAGFNCIRFDIPLLEAELARAGSPLDLGAVRVVDAQRIFHMREPRDLTAALRFFCGEAHEDAHGAMGDAEATLRVLEGQFRRYEDLPRSVEALHRLCDIRKPGWADRMGRLRWNQGEIELNFGKHKGKRLRDLVQDDPGLLKWILRGDFPADTQAIVQDALDGEFPAPPAPPPSYTPSSTA